MAIESNKTIFMGLPKPSDKCLLVAIPMNMYRVQTNKFTSGLNYFQKAVLKFKYMPQMSNSKISQILHLDEHLINLIVDQLEAKELITSTGFLTPKGEEMRNNADGFIINDDQRQIGYVFSYDGGNEYFPYYQNEICLAEITGNELTYPTEKGTRTVDLPLNVIDDNNEFGVAPTENLVLQIIKNSAYREMEGNGDIEDISNELFHIKFIPNNEAEQVVVCTYVYLPQLEDGNGYDDDWLVCDPFGEGNNYELKLFLEKECKRNKALATAFFNCFKDVVTENNRKFDESAKWFDEQVSNRIALLFDDEKYSKMDSHIQLAIHDVVEYYMRMERNDFRVIRHDQQQMFFMNMQAALESILIQDQSDREETFADLDINYGEYGTQEDRRECLKAVYKKKILSETTTVPRVLIKIKTGSWKGRSLLDYLMKFIMSLSCEPDLDSCKVIKVFKNRIDTIVGISQMRNHIGHGTTDANESNTTFGKNDAIEYFTFMTELITDYINSID